MKTRVIQDLLIVELKGRLDIHTNKGISDEINDLVQKNQGMHFILDFSGVEYLSSSGMGLLVTLQRALEDRKHKLKLAALNHAVTRIFTAVGMLENFEVFDTVNAAIDSF